MNTHWGIDCLGVVDCCLAYHLIIKSQEDESSIDAYDGPLEDAAGELISIMMELIIVLVGLIGYHLLTRLGTLTSMCPVTFDLLVLSES